MNHDNIMTTCYVNETDPTLDTVGFDDMANFDYAAFKRSIMSQCGGKQQCYAWIQNDITGIPLESQETYMYLYAQVACV